METGCLTWKKLADSPSMTAKNISKKYFQLFSESGKGESDGNFLDYFEE
jgi:hypothetical protein